jgi:CubicO group peptidase (beta-lactamase class C family)
MARLVIAVLLVVGPSVVSATAGQPIAVCGIDPAGIDQVVGDAVRGWQVPGAAVVVVRSAGVAHLKGYGVNRTGAADPVTPDTLFPLASCTKAFTAAAIAGLVDDRRMSLDEPARTHLPGFRLADPIADEKVTVRDLLSHRTGIGSHDYVWFQAPWGIDEVLRRVPHLSPAGRFRGGYEYSSIMVMAAGRAAANAAGQPWEQLVRRRVCGPAGVSPVAFTSAEAERVADRATGHRRDGAKTVAMPAYPMPEPNPAGSIHTTARGLAGWLRLQLGDGVIDGKRVVSAANLRETRKPHTEMSLADPTIGPVYPESKRVGYALGWVAYDYRGVNVVAHGGMIDGFRALMVLLPDHDLGFAILCNLDRTKMPIAVANTLIDRSLGLPAKDWNAYFRNLEAKEAADRVARLAARDAARSGDPKPTLPLADYAGEYADPGYGASKVTVEGGRLVWAWSSFNCTLEPYDRDTFRITDGRFADEVIEFRVRNGTADALRAVGVVFTRK